MDKRDAKGLCNSIREAFLEYVYSDDTVEDAKWMEALFAAIRNVEEKLSSFEKAIEIQKAGIEYFKEKAARAESNAGIIHCKDCKNATDVFYDDCAKAQVLHCDWRDQDVYESEFCSMAEKKTD